MNLLYRNVKKDVFILPSNSKEVYLFYSPLRNVAFFFSKNLCTEIINYFDKKEPVINEELNEYLVELTNYPLTQIPQQGTINLQDRLVILLTQKCNLACNYCFAQEARSNEVLSYEKICAAVSYIFSQENGNKKGFGFLGGGEPLICWETFVRVCEYIKEQSHLTQIPHEISLTTNATLLTPKRVEYIACNNIAVTISTDILPNIQDYQRPFAYNKGKSSEAVYNSIKLLHDFGVKFRLRATITHNNIDSMPDMIKYIHHNFPYVKHVSLEPVTDSSVDYESFYIRYRLKFIESHAFGANYGISVVNSLVNSLFHIKSNFCAGELCITPTGEITSCHRHSNKNDILFKKYQYGVISDTVIIDREKLNNIQNTRKSNRQHCENCFAQYHCAGGCTSQSIIFNEEQRNAFCSFVQDFLRDILEIEISK